MLKHYAIDEEIYREHQKEVENLFYRNCPHELQRFLNYEEVTHDLLIECQTGRAYTRDKRAERVIRQYKRQLVDIICYRTDAGNEDLELYPDR